MARKYTRDNRGRFASSGSGATARGGRLKTAAGNKRATQTMRAQGAGGPAGTIAKGGNGVRGSVARSLAATRKPAAAPAKAAPKAAPKVKLGAEPDKARMLRNMTNPGIRQAYATQGGKAMSPLNAKKVARSQATAEAARKFYGTSSRDRPKPAAPAQAKAASKAPPSPPKGSKPAAKSAKSAPKRLNFQVLHHGTSKEAAAAIRKDGFKASSDGFLGKGVYFSRDKKVAGYYKSVAEGKTGGGAVLRSRVLKNKVQDVKQDSFFVASAAAKKSAQGLLKKGKVASLRAPDDLQKVVATTAGTANRGLIREGGKIRRRRRK